MSIADNIEIEQNIGSKKAGEQHEFAGSLAMPSDYFILLKPRVMSLVIFTALVGLMLAPGSIHPFIALVAISAIAVGAGAAGALNMWYDADIDAIMSRTANRPIPAGVVAPASALTFGISMAFMAVMTLGVLVNWLSASLLAFTIFFYVIVYSHWLKRATPQNIVIGGIAGAFPPVIGWVAVANSIGIESIILFAIIFVWTPPHFWSLALFRSDDYKKAGIPMMPIVAGNRSTQNQIFGYSLLLAIVGVLPWVFGFGGIAYAVVSIMLGMTFVYFAFGVLHMSSDDDEMKPARKLFGFSIFYLFALFAVLLGEGMWAILF
ncbi:MAG: protoheme IX farnesyltransferase [Gammaproteobacteria bacterium]|nr:protoheme IX farnesyltransferase [Gammaproteobacteria bacterium]